MILKSKSAALAVLGFVLAGGVVVATEPDPKQGRETYYGSGYVERGPDYGEVYFTFSVNCLKSADAVRVAIEKVSAPVWGSIAKKVTNYSETERRSWGDISNITAEDASVLRVRESRIVNGKLIEGKTTRVSACEGKELPLDAPVGKVFSGSQTIGVRSADLDWVEGLLKSVQKLPQTNSKTEVKVNASSIDYKTTAATNRAMALEVKKQARERATGKGSVFESDRNALKFATAHLLSSRPAYSREREAVVGYPVEKGKAPKVSLDLPFVYTVYAEGADRIDPDNNPGSVPLVSEYKASGKAVAAADYAEGSVTLSAQCLASKEEAINAIKTQATDIVKQLEAFQGKKAPSETDRITVNEAASPNQFTSYEPIKWELKEGNVQAVEYFDGCSGKTIAAPAPGAQLPVYWQISRVLSVKSSDFAGLLQLLEDLDKKYGVSPTSRTATAVEVSDAVGKVTDASLAQLLIKAREDATACVLDPGGELADDASAQGFKCAHLKSIRIEEQFRGRGGLESAPGGSNSRAKGFAAEAAPQEPELDVQVEVRDGETRPRIKARGTYAFEYQFVSKDYVPLLKKGAPVPAPGSPARLP